MEEGEEDVFKGDNPTENLNFIASVAFQSSEEYLKQLNDHFEKGTLTSTQFLEHWYVWVPSVYRLPLHSNYFEWNFDNSRAKQILFNPLEKFISNGTSYDTLQALSELNKPAAVCGKVFKMGEPTYNCRECGMDNTCVLCVDCFKQSVHRHHKYKMGMSNGGGCCDCGDIEAWKTAPYCDIHLAGKTARDQIETTSVEQSSGLPEDVIKRCEIIFQVVLSYAFALLTFEHTVIPQSVLPSSLSAKDKESLNNIDSFCTVLYNDETHTFEQVITTLTRLLKCNQRESVEHVTRVDKEGRAILKCDSFKLCSELKTEIDKFTSRHGNKPLKTLVIHSFAISHQIFALKLLEWLPKILARGEDFRNIFTSIVCKNDENIKEYSSLVEGIMLRDSIMWKSARSHWHELFISGMLLEYENKKALAKIFTKNYGNIIKDYIRDDHEQAFSISSLSVQLYTTPTLAHYLIAHEDVLYILLNTFISECQRKCNKNGKLEFEKNNSNVTFKRSQIILYDVRYLLNVKPKEWNDELRQGFLQGLSLILNLLIMMQGMDAVARQVGQHLEYEPEWESAFNMHFKLAGVISLMLDWCGSDLDVLMKAYKVTLKKLHANSTFDPMVEGEVKELADHSAVCFQYDVASQPATIHLPLSRFFAGLHLYLEKHNLSFSSFQCIKPTPEQILEPVLRTQTMISQVHAGMWRRNGYALLNQLYFYHNVKCRTEMLDRDIVLLQIAGSLIESNEFMIHIINKFNLLNWAASDFEEKSLKNPEEDCIRQTINLVEELLGLFITIIGERFVPGVGKVTVKDRIKKEIIQQLCVKPLAHSELIKCIPEEIVSDVNLDSLINEVATFKKPIQSKGKGAHELKDEYYKDYNVFYYHYTREDLSKSEEIQRKRRKTAGELECCPPPELPELADSFGIIVDLLQCDVMMHILRTVLTRSLNLRARSFSEPQLHKALFLIGYGLQEQESNRYPFLKFTECALKYNLFELIEELSMSPRVESHKDLLIWTLNKYKQIANLQADDKQTSESVESNSSMETAKNEKEWRAKMAAEKRAKIMAQIANLQSNFMKENAKLFEENNELNNDRESNLMDYTESPEVTVCLGSQKTQRIITEKKYTCILCQESQILSSSSRPLVLASFVQQSTVLCQKRFKIKETSPYLLSNLDQAPYTSTCGHVMHSHCFQKHFDNIYLKENRRPYRMRHPSSFDVEKREYLCPLCECLNNTALPLIPPLGSLQSDSPSSNISFEEWLKELGSNAVLLKSLNESDSNVSSNEIPEDSSKDEKFNSFPFTSTTPKPKDLKSDEFSKVPDLINVEFKKLFESDFKQVNDSLVDMISMFGHIVLGAEEPNLKNNTKSIDMNDKILLGVWRTCSYTIRTMEILLRELNKPLLGDLSLRQRDCLESLVRVSSIIITTSKQKSFVVKEHTLDILLSLVDLSYKNSFNILKYDSFGIFVPLILSLPSIFSKDSLGIATGNLQELYVFKLVFLSHIAKIIITNDFKEDNDLDESMEVDLYDFKLTESEELIIDTIYKLIRAKNNLSNYKIWSRIREASIPFLRCCVLFFHFLTDVPAPLTLTSFGGDTFTNLLSYLGLSDSVEELLGGQFTIDLFEKWCYHPSVLEYLERDENNYYPFVYVIKEPIAPPRLVDLPNDYSELLNSVSAFTCPNSGTDDSRNPTMCLMCGKILCSQSYCCQTEFLDQPISVGACTWHAHKCGGGIGIFLRVRECEILFLASTNRGCFVSAPYLDEYGETDQGLKRGDPLHLSLERYKSLQLLWLSHNLYEEIVHFLESTNTIMTTQWIHL